MISTTKFNGYESVDYIESAYPSNNEPAQIDNSSNIFTRLSRVIYSIFDWSSNNKQYNPHPTDNNV